MIRIDVSVQFRVRDRVDDRVPLRDQVTIGVGVGVSVRFGRLTRMVMLIWACEWLY